MSDTATIAVELTFPSLPEGWKGKPQAFLQWISENAIFSATGSFLTGQIGGARPVSNIGIFVNGQTIEVWSGGSGGKYVPLLTMPVGVVLDWPAPSLAPPDNFLFAEGQLLNIADYPELSNVLGRIYSRPADDNDTFRLPDYRGRVGVGAGDTAGINNPMVDSAGGIMTLRTVGSYFGAEWPNYRSTVPLNSPTPRYSAVLQGSATSKPNPFSWNKTTFNGIQPPSIGTRKIIRIR